MVIVLLEHIDLFTTCMNIVVYIDSYCSVDIILNVLSSSRKITGHKPAITHPFVTDTHGYSVSFPTTCLFIKQ